MSRGCPAFGVAFAPIVQYKGNVQRLGQGRRRRDERRFSVELFYAGTDNRAHQIWQLSL